MPVEITVVSQEYKNQYNNGENFISNPSDYTLNLAGSVMEEISILTKVEVQSIYYVTETSPIEYIKLSNWVYKVKKSNGTFRDEGFSVGDTLRIYDDADPTVYQTGTVIVMTDTWMTVDYDSQPNVMAYATFYIVNTTEPTALIFKPNLIENTESFNIISKISGGDSGFYLAGITSSFQVMQGLGNYKGFITGTVEVKSDTSTFTGVFAFSIKQKLLIAPFYLEGWDNYLEGLAVPPIFNGLASLKYVFECDFRTVISNPNTSKVGRYEMQLGSTAWFNENFNGFNNNYAVDSIDYVDAVTAGSTDGVLSGGKTKITIIVKKTNGTFSPADRIGLYISYLPLVEEYTDTLTSAKDNFMFDDRVVDVSSISSIGTGIIKTIESSLLNSTTIELIAEVEYSVAQQLILNEDSKYIIGVGITSTSLSSGNSDRVVLLADYNNYEASADISDLMGIDTFTLQHYDDVISPTDEWTSIYAWNEDGISSSIKFWLDTNLDALVKSLDFMILAYNNSTGEYFELDKYSFNVASSAIIGGVQQLVFNETRNYNLSTDVVPAKFNVAEISTGVNVSGKQYYNMAIGQKISWQDWISNLDVPSIFYDSTKPQDNKNYKSSNYSNILDYSIRFAIKANVYGTNALGQSGLTDYLFLTPVLTIYDYETPTEWSALIETFHPTTLANLQGAVLIGEDTIMKVTWTNSGGAVTSLSDIYVEHGIQDTGDNGYNTDISSTLFAVATTNKLKTMEPLAIVSGNVVSQCLIDGNLIDSPQDLTAKLLKTLPIVPQGSKLMEDSTAKETESGVIKTVE